MKKLYLFVALVLCAQILWAANKPVTDPEDIPAYYSSLNNTSGASLWSAVSKIASKNRGNIGYDGLYDAYIQTDSYPADSVGKAGKIWDMYSECGFEHNQKKCGEYKTECDCYNREHSIPKSWFGGSTSGIGCDIFHVVPTDGKVNGMRSAFVYGEVTGTPSYTSNMGHKKGSGASIHNERKTICAAAGSTTPCSATTVFEPVDQYKGDFARGYMGTMASWNADMTKSEGSDFFQSTYTASTNFGLTAYGVALLMKWHREDPVSQKEIDRNNGIQKTQGNRNPFIDYPYLAEYIWGEHAGETVDMDQLIASCDAAFIPGQSTGWNDGSVPPVPQPTIKHGVNWMVNGEEQQVDSVKENNKVTSLPDEPTSCSNESNVFVGWTNAPINGSSDDAPAVLYTKPADFPAVTTDVTYYAVFAKQTTTQSGQVESTETINLSACGYSNGQEVTSKTQNGVTLVFAKNDGSNPPKYYDGGSAVRCYPKNTMTVAANNITGIVLTYGSSDGTNAITTNVGTFSTNTWTGSANEVIFTIGGSSGNRRIAAVAVTMNGQGSNTVTSRYITSCQSTTEIETVRTHECAKKVLVGGHIYIQHSDGLYTITGQRVK